jgi:hypothetical protein
MSSLILFILCARPSYYVRGLILRKMNYHHCFILSVCVGGGGPQWLVYLEKAQQLFESNLIIIEI